MPRPVIHDIGMTVLYKPPDGEPIVDIVLVHGLQGHPHKTWACRRRQGTENPPATSQLAPSGEEGRQSKSFRRSISRFTRRMPGKSSSVSISGHDGPSNTQATDAFWPRDFLPEVSPMARIMVFGYDTKVTKYMRGAINKNGIYQHGKDLMFALSGNRTDGEERCRPLVFIAHSLGGIVVKEMLARSSASNADEHWIVTSTLSVIFLGTPHRGSPDLAALGQSARFLISTMGMETSAAILDALGLRTTDLERAQDAFSDLWTKHKFQVKTFREGLGLTGVNFGVLGNKVVPDYSSLIGDPRERAETIQANHMDMCRFRDQEDQGYKQIVKEILRVCNTHVKANLEPKPFVHESLAHRPKPKSLNEPLSNALPFYGMNSRYRTIEEPVEGTCEWLFRHQTYSEWFEGQRSDQHKGLLWLKAKPGAGKSTIMKEAFTRAARQQESRNFWLAAFFFNAKGEKLEHSPLGLFRSLLYQLLPHCPEHLENFAMAACSPLLSPLKDGQLHTWLQQDCEKVLRGILTTQHAEQIIIFIDALDECDASSMAAQAEFWRDVTCLAHASGSPLSVCIASRKFPHVAVSAYTEIDLEDYNRHDIARYIDQRLRLRLDKHEPELQPFRDSLLMKSAGSFLWVVLVLEDLLKGHDRGQNVLQLMQNLKKVPAELGDLYTQLIGDVEPPNKLKTLRLFQWAILAAKPLRLNEWHHLEALLEGNSLQSLGSWRNALEGSNKEAVAAVDDKLAKRLVDLSRGLLEVTTSREIQDCDSDQMSVVAVAGSLDLESGETRVIQVIHDSVREFFLNNNGFALLDSSSLFSVGGQAIANGHLSIVETCLDYINIKELDELVEARIRANDSLTSQSQRGDNMSSEDEPITADPADLRRVSPHYLEGENEGADYGPEPTTSQSNSNPYAPRTLHQSVRSDLVRISPRLCPHKRTASVASFSSAGSHDSSQGPSARDCELPYRRKQRILEFPQDMTHAADSTAATDVALWVQTAQISPNLPQDRLDDNSSTFTGKSHILEAFPALLSYTTSHLFHHIRMAEAFDTAPSPHFRTWVVKKLVERWSRWLALREDIAYKTELLYYMAVNGPEKWIQGMKIYASQIPAQALLQSIEKGNNKAFYLLVQNIGYDDQYDTCQYGPILHTLTRLSDAEFLAIYLEKMSHCSRATGYWRSLNREDSKGRSPLQLAVMVNNLDAATLLLRSGANVDFYNKDGRTALQTACLTKLRKYSKSVKRSISPLRGISCAMVKMLLDHGADVNKPELSVRIPNAIKPTKEVSYTALLNLCCSPPPAQLADSPSLCPLNDTNYPVLSSSLPHCRYNQCMEYVHVVKELLNRGSNPNVTGGEGETPLHAASVWGDNKVVRELVSRGARVEDRDIYGQTALHYAVWNSDVSTVKTLVKFGAPLDHQDHKGWMPLQMACHPNSKQNKGGRGLLTIRYLLEKGAKGFMVKNFQGHSAFDIANYFRFQEAVTLLMAFGSDSPVF